MVMFRLDPDKLINNFGASWFVLDYWRTLPYFGKGFDVLFLYKYFYFG